MKKVFVIILHFLLAIYNVVWAEDKLSIDDFYIALGESKDMNINLKLDNEIVAFQFDLYLPKGISYQGFSYNKNDLPNGTELSMSVQDDGCLRFLAIAYERQSFPSNYNGTIIKVSLEATNTKKTGSFVGYLSNVKLSKIDGTGVIYPQIPFSVTILEPSIVTAKNYYRLYGEPNPFFDCTYSGGDLYGVPEFSCEATDTSPVGCYEIVVRQGTIKNYKTTYVNGTLTINKAPLTITAKSYIIKWGETLPIFEVEYNGFKNNETSDVLKKQPSIYCEATLASMPGTYDIIVSNADADNYEILYTKGTLTILPPQKGDVNNDEVIDAEDLSCETLFILEDADDTMYFGSADMDDSGIVEVNDYAALVNLFLSQRTNDDQTNITSVRRTPQEDDSYKLCDVTYTAIAGTTGFNGFEGYSSLVDGNDDTKWCSSTGFANSHGGLPYYIIFRASEKISPTWYRLLTGNDTRIYPDRNWKSWKIYGANFTDDNVALTSYNITNPVDNKSRRSSDWVLIDDKIDFNLPATNFTEVEVTLSNPSAEKFQYFLIEIYETVGNNTAQMSELSFGSHAIVIPDNPIQDKNVLSVPSQIDVRNGEYFNLPISLTNEDDICSLQFDLTLPTGFVIATDDVGKAVAELSERTDDKRHTVLSRKLDNGLYRVIIISETNDTFENDSSEILTIGILSSEDLLMGDYKIIMQNIVLTNPIATRYVTENISGILSVAEPVTITAKSYMRIYGDANPIFEYEVSGAALEGTPEITCEATPISPVGTYSIIVQKGSVTNYNDTYVNGTLTITKAPLKVIVKDVEREQGEENPQFELVYEGWKLEDSEDVLIKKPTILTSATKESPVGEYVITAGGGEAENYELTYQYGKLTVTVPSSLAGLIKSGHPFDVYDIKGRKVLHQVTTLKGLPKGVYIIDRKKITVK